MTMTSVHRPVRSLPGVPVLRGALVGLEVLVGLAAVYGGVQMLADPRTPMGATTHLLRGSPFSTFRWPGVLLMVLVGLAPLVLAAGLLARARGAVALSAAFGIGLLAWIVVQWALLSEQLWLPPAVFTLGLAVVVLALALHRRGAR